MEGKKKQEVDGDVGGKITCKSGEGHSMALVRHQGEGLKMLEIRYQPTFSLKAVRDEDGR